MFQSHSVEVRDLGRLMLRRRRVVLLTTIAFLALALALNTFTRPVYRTAARLEIQPTPTRSPLTGAEVETPTTVSENLTLLTTAERILTSDVIEHTVREVTARGIHLEPKLDDPQFASALTPEMKLRIGEAIRTFEREITDFGQPRVLTIALHPHLSGVPHRINFLTELIDDLRARSDTVFMNGSQITDWYLGQKVG